jgi:putative SOS response-associated peptidase YedK
MCNHYRLHPEALPSWREYIGYREPEGEWSETKIDIWPKYEAVVARHEEGAQVLDRMAWGVPTTVKGKSGKPLTKHVTNVRNLTSPFWKSMLANPARRCLVPFSQFAEPKIGQGREEHWFAINDAPVSCFAGIWRPSEAGNVFAFLTCEPNALVAPLHPKAMPVILHPEDYETWLTTDYDGACALAQPFPSQLMGVA